MTNSEARKRHQSPPAIHQEPASPTVAPDPTDDALGPQIAAEPMTDTDLRALIERARHWVKLSEATPKPSVVGAAWAHTGIIRDLAAHPAPAAPTDGEAMRDQLRKAVEASAARPAHEKRFMPAIAADLAAHNAPADGARDAGRLNEDEKDLLWPVFEDYRRGRFTTPYPFFAAVKSILRARDERVWAEGWTERHRSTARPNPYKRQEADR